MNNRLEQDSQKSQNIWKNKKWFYLSQGVQNSDNAQSSYFGKYGLKKTKENKDQLKVDEKDEADIDGDEPDSVALDSIAHHQSANFQKSQHNSVGKHSEKLDIKSSQYGSSGPAMNSNQFNKLKTKDYPRNVNFEANSLGRNMDIDASRKGSNKKNSDDQNSVDSQEVADINETVSVLQTDGAEESLMTRTVQNAENTFQMGDGYKQPVTKSFMSNSQPPESVTGYKQAITKTFMSSQAADGRRNNQQLSLSSTHQIQEPEGDSSSKDAKIEATPKEKYLEQVRENSRISLSKLNAHICKYHPKKFDRYDDQYKDFSLSGNIPSLATCCQKRKIPKVSQAIGLGPSLFLITLKAYIRLFFVVTLLSIPTALIIQGAVSDPNEQKSGLNFVLGQDGGVTLDKIVVKKTIACAMDNIAKNIQKWDLSCPKGTFSRISSVGLNDNVGQDFCNSPTVEPDNFVTFSITGRQYDNVPISELPWNAKEGAKTFYNYAQYDYDCGTLRNADLIKSDFITSIVNTFDLSCLGKSSCILPYDYSIMPSYCLDTVLYRSFYSEFSDLYQYNYNPANPNINNFPRDMTYEYRPAFEEPELYIIAECNYKEPVIKEVAGAEGSIQEEQEANDKTNNLNFMVVLTDIFLISILVLGVNIIRLRQKEYIQAYKEQVVETRGFTLEVDHLPETFSQHKCHLCMKFAIWKQIQTQLSLCQKEGKCPGRLDHTIIEISLITSDVELNHKMVEIRQLLEDIEKEHAIILQAQGNNRRFAKNDTISQAKVRITEKVNALSYKLDILKIKYGEELKMAKPDIAQEEIDEIDELKVKKDAKRFLESINRIYITFASMETRNFVEKLFPSKDYSKMLRLTNRCNPTQNKITVTDFEVIPQNKIIGNGPLFIAQKPKGKDVYYVEGFNDKKDKPMEVVRAKCEPEVLNWANMSFKNRTLKRMSSLTAIISLILLTFLLFFIFQSRQFLSYKEANAYLTQSRSCSQNYTIRAAYDLILVDESKVPCFCYQQYNYNFSNFLDINFNDYNKELQQGEIDAYNLALKKTYENQMEVQRLEELAQDEKLLEDFVQPTEPTSTSNTEEIKEPEYLPDYVAKSTLPEYCEIWLENYLLGRTLENGPQHLVNFLNNGFTVPVVLILTMLLKYWSSDEEKMMQFVIYSVVWIANIGVIMVIFLTRKPEFEIFDPVDQTAGSTIGFALFNLFAPQLFVNGVYYLFFAFKRFKDRSFRKSMNNGDYEEDDVYSRSAINQYKLNHLYTGKPFDFSLVQGHVTTIIFVTLMYCGVMPVLYPLCFIFLAAIYFYSKLCILKFCSISYDVTESFIMGAHRSLSLALIAHFFISLYLFISSTAFSNDLSLTRNASPEEQWSIKLFNFFTAYQVPERNKHDLQIVELYFDFCIFALTLFLLNIFLINPATFLFKGFSRKEHESNYDSNNTSNYSIQAKGCMSSSHEEIMEKVPSKNYLQEVSVETLQHQYESNLDSIVEANRRLQLYFRIAKINEDSEMGNIFMKKFENFRPYYQMLVDNKERIERQIDARFEEQDLAIELDKVDQEDDDTIQVDEVSIHDIDSPKSEIGRADLESAQIRRDTHLGLRAKLTFQLRQSQTLATGKLEDMANTDINKLINTLQRQSTTQIESLEAKFESDIRKNSRSYFKKMSLLSSSSRLRSNIQSYSINAKYPKTKECIALAEMLIADPYLDEIFKK